MGILRVLRSIRHSQSGNVFFALFGAVALVGVVGASSMQIMKGPVRSMSEVTKRTVAENNMIASAKLALIAATSGATGGDCDNDGFVEPTPFETAGGAASPLGGGFMPSSIGAALNDPWDTRYGYCVWDHGAVTTGCTGQNYLAGENGAMGYAIAIISAGPDRQFQTACSAYPTVTALNKTPGTDDIVLGYTYGEASALSGGLWELKDGDAETAEIQRNLEVKDSGGNTTFALDADTGMGDFIGIMTGSIAGKSGPLDITGGLKFEDTGIANGGACTGDDSFAYDGTLESLVRCNGATWVPASGSDNLGNHEATENIQLGTHWLTGDATGNDGIQINAAGAVTTSGSVAVGGDLTTSGFATIGTTLGVTGATSLSTLSASGLATLNTATVTGAAGVGGTLNVTGGTTLTSLTGTGAASLDSLAVTNAATIGTTLGVTGATTLTTLTTTGLTMVESLGVTNNLSIGGNLDLTGGRISNLLDPVAVQDAATKAYVDARVASGSGFVEQDPQVGVIQTGKWCIGNNDGTAIICDQNVPGGGAGDNLGDHIATQRVRFFSTAGSSGTVVSGTGDNLGNHTATQNINLGTTRFISPDGGNSGLSLNSGGGVHSVGSVSGFNASPRDGSGSHWVFYNPTGDDMRLWRTGIGDAMTILQNGNVGIGTTTPLSNLHVASGTAANPRGIMSSQHNDGTDGPQINFLKSRGASTSPTAVLSGDALMAHWAQGWTGTAYATSAGIRALASENFTLSAAGSKLEFLTADLGTNVSTAKMTIAPSGNVGIGTEVPTQKLDVVGTVRATNIHTTQICNTSGASCVAQSALGGGGGSPSGSWCGVASGSVCGSSVCPATLTNIHSCNGSSIASNCPSGYTAFIYSSGAANCGSFSTGVSCSRTCIKN